MHNTTLIAALALFSAALAAPTSLNTRAAPCFQIGAVALPAEVSAAATSLQSVITCNAAIKTLVRPPLCPLLPGTNTPRSNVPDVTSGSTSFSSINFASSKLTPLGFALSEFATATPLASTDLALFQDRLNVYVATEVGVRSVGGGLALKVPKFFLSYQIARIKTAQGVAITDPGQTVEHLLGKVTKNAAGESKALLGQVTKLATVLA